MGSEMCIRDSHKEILDKDELTWLLEEEPNAAHQFLAKRDHRSHYPDLSRLLKPALSIEISGYLA